MPDKKSFWDNPDVKNKKEHLLIVFEVIVILFCSYNLAFTSRIFPNVSVAGIDIGGKKEGEAITSLSQKVSFPTQINLTASNQTFNLETAALKVEPDYSESVEAAFNLHRTGNLFWDFYLRTISLVKKNKLGLRIKIDKQELEKALAVVAGQVEIEAKNPSLTITNGTIVVDRGQPGIVLDRNLLKVKIGEAYAFAKNTGLEIPVKEVNPALTAEEANLYQARGERLIGKKLTFKFEDSVFDYQNQELLTFLNPKEGYQDEIINQTINRLAKSIDREPGNAAFVFENGRVQEFRPSLDGLKVKEDLLAQMIIGNLRTLEETEETTVLATIPVDIAPPEIKTGDINNLGIKELIGKGVSYFAGSIPGRIHNINLAAPKFKGVLVKPDETLSFNTIVGDISAATGFQQAYIIKEGKTILGDGGGVCQVSTTLFRAALNAGLPILERTAHAYRVGYYEQRSPPGLDATVYSPTTDLKIKNNTRKHILVQTTVDNSKVMLVFEIYGTNDGRTATTSKPVVAGITAPPNDIYQDDPTLPLGKIIQTEHKAAGAKVTFTYQVERDNEVIYQKTFVSNYKPWAAVYLRGTGPAQ